MPARWLALGDSYTAGEGVPGALTWTSQLAAALQHDGIDIDVPRVIATTGWTTDELAAGIAAAQPLGSWDFVTLGIGVNDHYRDRSAADYRSGLLELIDTATALVAQDPSRVLMVSIPDWGVTPFAANEGRDARRVACAIDEFNAVAQDICMARGIAFVDVTPASRLGGGEPAMLAEDGLHPSAAMYARWVALLRPVARQLLQHA